MFDTYVWLNILLAFVVGGAWIAIVTMIVDKSGSKLGGFLAGFPSTSMLSFFFIALVQGTQVASQATTVFPLAIGLASLFLVSFAFLSKRGFYIGLVGSLLVWLVLAGVLILSNLGSFAIALIAYAIIIILVYYVLEHYLRIKSTARKRITYSKSQILFRALFGGAIVAFAVFMSKIGGPIYGGVFAAFPAIFTSTLIIVYRTNGIDAARAVTKSMAIGLISAVLYSFGVRYAYPIYGLALGTMISFIIAIICSYFTYRVIKKMK